MKKIIMWMLGIAICILLIVAIVGMIKFGILADDIYDEQGVRI